MANQHITREYYLRNILHQRILFAGPKGYSLDELFTAIKGQTNYTPIEIAKGIEPLKDNGTIKSMRNERGIVYKLTSYIGE